MYIVVTNIDHISSELKSEFKKIVDSFILNKKIALISRIFGYDKFIGQDKKCLKNNKYYYNDLFDELYDKSIDELEEIDQELHLACEQYSNALNRYGTEEG